MKMLVLRPDSRMLGYSIFSSDQRDPLIMSTIQDYQSSNGVKTNLRSALQKIHYTCQYITANRLPDMIAVHAAFGGNDFHQPTLVTQEVLHSLEILTPQAPLHIPPLQVLIHQCRLIFPDVPIILVFDTAFIVSLPPQEHLYALDSSFMKTTGLRRYGFHGTYHEAACDHVMLSWRGKKKTKVPCILSICLEPRPEVAAVVGRRPVMVTSGATPLEGIPGETTCGELDPGIVVAMNQTLHEGPEEINLRLTRESGLRGLAGEGVTFETVFQPTNVAHSLARNVLLYHFLRAAGAGIAAMGGLDTIIFSGRYVKVGKIIGLWLRQKLISGSTLDKTQIELKYYQESPDRIIADQAMTVWSALQKSDNLQNKITASCTFCEA
jgi:acetate kinase